MATKNDVLKLSLDVMNNRVSGNFSAHENMEAIREGLMELSGGVTKLTPKNFYRGSELFAYVEEILPYIDNSGLKGDEFWMNLVDERNLALGDQNEFWTQDKSLFLVGTPGDGSQSVRRQRLNVGESVTIPTKNHAVKVYEEMNRILSGRVDFNTFVERVGQSLTNARREEIMKVFESITKNTAGLSDTYVISGTYSENKLLELVSHVEAATGKSATIFGTKAALRKVQTAVMSDEAKSDYYGIGYFGRVAGVPMVSVKQAHKLGTDEFLLNDNKLYVFASDDKPIKHVTEGEVFLAETNFAENQDLTQTYFINEKFGTGLIVNDKMGLYTLS